MKQYTVADRIDLVVATCFGGTQLEMSRATGIGQDVITRMKQGQTKLSRYYCNKICRMCPAINPEWLLSGEGYPGDLTPQLVRDKYESIIAELRCELAMQRDVIRRLTREK